VEKSAQALAVPCPRHKGLDHIRQVSVVYAEAAPALLSPVPILKSADRLAWAGTIIGAAGAVIIWIGTATHGGVPGWALAVASVCFAYAIACYGWAAVRRASVVRIRRGMDRALSIWREGWYCERCDGVFFAPGTRFPAAALPAGAVTGQLMSAGEFQHLVWTAGGYEAQKVS
jgi:hypothetical protein